MKTDWGAKWFEIRESMGESDMVTLRYRDQGGPWKNLDFPHRHGDGFGKLLQILKSENIPVAPLSRPLRPPSEWKKPFLLVDGALRHPKTNVNPWRFFDKSRGLGSPDDSIAITWNAERTLEQRERAKKLGVTPAFLIMNDVNRWLRSNLAHTDSTLTWLFPVDLRGAFPETPLNALCVSFLPISAKAELGISEIYQNFRKALKRQDYWSYWELYQIGKWVGENGVEKIARRAAEKSFWAGSLSDLGVWNNPELAKHGIESREWTMSPPGSANYPVGVAMIEWCGRRQITIKVHPAVTPEAPRATAEKMLTDLGYF